MHPLRDVLDLLAPARCLGCRLPGATLWCRACARAATRLRLLPECERCGAESTDRDHGCWPEHGPVGASIAAFRYEGVVADAVVAVKVRGAFAALPALGEHVANAWRRTQRAVDVVTWVPADPRRRRARGFDQAEVLACVVAGSVGIPVVPALTARRGRADQASLPTARRRLLADGEYRPRLPVDGAAVLLVDDVLTTGATAETAASALRRGGARRVEVAVLARAGVHVLGRDAAPWDDP